MPLTHFIGFLLAAVVAAGLTLVLALWLDMPLAAFSLATLSGSLILGARQWI